jgi:hypothetical protein
MKKMKKLNLLLGTLIATAALSHAVDSYSEVVGYQKLVSSQGFTTVSMPLVKPAIVTGTVSSKSGSSITLSASIPAGTDATKPYYLEVTSGTLAGERADVTVTAGSAVVVIAASSYNTSALSTLASGDSVLVRAHVTLADLDASCSPGLVGDDVNGDRVLFFVNGAFVPYMKASDGSWYEDGGLDDMSNLPMRPGIGMLIHRRAATATTLTQTGVVRANKFARPVAKGFSFFAPAYPVDLSPDAMGAKPTFGWSNGDRILPFVNGAFVNNILDTSDTTGGSYGTWYEDGGLDPLNATTLVNSQKSAMVYNNNSGAGSVETSPVAQ